MSELLGQAVVRSDLEFPQPVHSAADLLVAYLEQIGVNFVFGVPGGAIEPLYDALARSGRRGAIQTITARHETGAAFMADGYHAETGRLGVVCATTGPGATNLITGVASAYQNNVPMLVITAQTPLNSFGSWAFQESSCTGIDTLRLFEPVTHYNSLVSHAEQLERKLVNAIRRAFDHPRGPVHLTIPRDLFRDPAPVSRPSYRLDHLLTPKRLLDTHAMEAMIQHVSQARRVAVVLGGRAGVGAAQALEFANAVNARVVTTPDAKGLISPHHPLFSGVIGFAGHTSARQVLEDPDVSCVIAAGTSMSEWAVGGWSQSAVLSHKLIQVSEDRHHLERSPMAKLHVQGSTDAVFSELLSELGYSGSQDDGNAEQSRGAGTTVEPLEQVCLPLDEADKWTANSTRVLPQRLMHELPKLFPLNTCYVPDTGNSVAWATHYLHPQDRRLRGLRAEGGASWYRSCVDFASMGWAIGCAIGVALQRRRPTVCITGDGSWLMSAQELTVAVELRLPVIFIILNDQALGMVRHGQRMTGAESIGANIGKVDFAALAQAQGARSFMIKDIADLLALNVDSWCEPEAGPTVLDVRVDPEQKPPIGMRISALTEQ